MVNFLLIGLVLLLFIFLMFKTNQFKTKVAYLFIIVGVFFLLLIAYFVFSDKEINLKTVEGVSSSIKVYVSWISTAVSNVFKVSSYVFNQEWKNENASGT